MIPNRNLPTNTSNALDVNFRESESRPVGSLGPTLNRCLKKLEALYRDLGGPEPDLE